ncbi:MAG: 1,4-beta-xylanase [Chitinophagaceae bacterium]|nr:1,4-beta-xylanase [Chitinophagaceae bacterium]
MKSFIVVAFLLYVIPINAQKIIALDNKGSEKWDWNEKETSVNAFNARLVYNVSHPTLTVFPADSAVANGTAIIICPGGAFQILSIESEGYEVAKWLNKKGVTAFVLKYRLAHSVTNDPVKELFAKQPNTEKFNEEIKPLVAFAITDGLNAITYVRKHAVDYNIAGNRIGIIGFSAGGTVAAGVAYTYSGESRPDFAAPIYPYVGSFAKSTVPADAPPLFTIAAADDQFGFDKHAIRLYEDWLGSKHVAELHIYAKGGHGFGMHKQNLPVDNWIEAFNEWLIQQGFEKK